jgi:dTDP-4-amino-4,6-dideoxygalactose transaminase
MNNKMPISESIASSILCLPLYVGLYENDLFKLVSIINE